MSATIRQSDAIINRSTEHIEYEPVYIISCSLCKRKQIAITFEQATDLSDEHYEGNIKGVCVKDKQTVEVFSLSLEDVFTSDQRFTHEKYLLYKHKTDEYQPLAPQQRCVCNICVICWNGVGSISAMEDGIFERVALTQNCLDCFVICGGRKVGW